MSNYTRKWTCQDRENFVNLSQVALSKLDNENAGILSIIEFDTPWNNICII